MSSKIENALAGIASLNSIFVAYTESPDFDARQRACLADIANGFSFLLSDNATRSAAYAMACGALNTKFQQGGWLFSVSQKGSIDFEHIDGQTPRQLLSAMLHD